MISRGGGGRVPVLQATGWYTLCVRCTKKITSYHTVYSRSHLPTSAPAAHTLMSQTNTPTTWHPSNQTVNPQSTKKMTPSPTTYPISACMHNQGGRAHPSIPFLAVLRRRYHRAVSSEHGRREGWKHVRTGPRTKKKKKQPRLVRRDGDVQGDGSTCGGI